MGLRKPIKSFKDFLRGTRKSSQTSHDAAISHSVVQSTSTVDVPRPSDHTQSGNAKLPIDTPVSNPSCPASSVQPTGEAILLWTEAYDSLIQDDQDLADAFERVLTERHSLQSAAAGMVNMFTGRGGQARIELMASVARDAVENVEKHAPVLEGVEIAAQLVGTVSGGISKLLDAYPPAALTLSGVAVMLPVLIKPIKARTAVAACLKYILRQTEWYLSLSSCLLSINWSDNRVFEQHRGTLRKTLLNLYKSLLQLEMRSVCRYQNPQWLLASLKEMLSLVDWEGDLTLLKELEKDAARKIKQYNTQALVDDLHRISTQGTDLTKEMKRASGSLDKLVTQTQGWREEQAQRHRDSIRIQLSKLIGKFNTTRYKDHMMRNKDRIEGTCQWFCNHEKFNSWLEPESAPVLVVSADPGCGKSTLAQYLIETVLPRRQPDATICYFFFKDNQEQRTTSNALCAVLHRLFDQRPELIEAYEEKILKYGDVLFSDAELLWEVLTTVLSHKSNQDEAFRGSIICVLDALDECDPSGLYALLKNLDAYLTQGEQDNSNQCIKFLLTTRGYPQILQNIKVLQSRILRLAGEGKNEMDEIQQEITLVVNHRLERLVKMKDINMETEKTIRRSMEERGSSQRTYLWVKLVFVVLEENFDDDPAEWEYLINNPPQTVFETYEKLLQRVKPKDKEFVRLLVRLVFAAERPLSLCEMNVAIEVRGHINANDLLGLSINESFRARVIDACGFFITVYDDHLYFIHHTAREFLSRDPGQGALNTPDSKWGSSITVQLAHRTMAESCISFLSIRSVRSLDWSRVWTGNKRNVVYYEDDLFEDLQDWTSDTEFIERFSRERYEFLKYAIRNWTNHFRLAQVLDQNCLVDDIGEEFISPYLSLFVGNTPISQTWVAHLPVFYIDPLNSRRTHDIDYTLTEMGPYIATVCDHIRPLKTGHTSSQEYPYVSTSGYPNDRRMRGPLTNIADVLVDWAISARSHITLRYLLDTYPHLQPLYGRFLRDSCDHSYPARAVVQLLLDKGANVNECVSFKMPQDDLYSTPLLAAFASYTPPDIRLGLIRHLLANHADISAISAAGTTLLHVVASHRRRPFKDTIETLLDHGADIDVCDHIGRSPLSAMCSASMDSHPIHIHYAIRALVDFGANPSHQDVNGYTPLHFVCARAMTKSLQALLRFVTDVEPLTVFGHTPLHLTCMTFLMYLSDGTTNLEWPYRRLLSPFWDPFESRHYRISELIERGCRLRPSRSPSVSPCGSIKAWLDDVVSNEASPKDSPGNIWLIAMANI
ncbi:hypothetical protein F5B20DRAFT_252786 [Whalleya microplaca]|nr:hypothetical protein F5B20DRAFT_252786 [Whalleya microplaca]